MIRMTESGGSKYILRHNNLGNGLKFSGAQQARVEASVDYNFITATTPYSLVVAFQKNTQAAQATLFTRTAGGATTGIYLDVYGDKLAAFEFNSVSNYWAIEKSGVIVAGRIHIAAFVKDPSGQANWKLYVDGVLLSGYTLTTLGAQPAISGNFPLSFGGRLGNSFSLDGYLFSVQLYNRMLTDTEARYITGQAATQPASVLSSCKGLWTLDKRQGSVAPDLSGLKHPANLLNFTYMPNPWVDAYTLTPLAI